MLDESSIVTKTEHALDDFVSLWKRRRLLCLIVAAIIAVPGCLSIYLQWVAIPTLKSEITDRDSQIANLRETLSRVEHERDKAQLELAPYHAVRQRAFPDVPPDKGADLLLARLELAVQSLQDVTATLSGERKISDEVKKTMLADLKTIAPMNVIIECTVNDREADALGRQIESIFQEAGWRIERFSFAIHNRPLKPLTFMFREPPSPQLQRVFATLFNNFGYPRLAYTDPQLGENDLKILVGSR